MRPIKWGKRGRELKIEANVKAESIAKVILHYRLATETAYRTILMENSSGGIYRATIDAKQISGRVFYSIEAIRTSGEVFGLGSTETPLPLMIPQAQAAERVDVPVSF